MLRCSFLAAALLAFPELAAASHTPDPSSVTVAGSLQSELGCSEDWQPACAASHLAFDAEDGVWQGTFNVPAGSWEYKAPLNDGWDENYGLHAAPNGGNIPLSLSAATSVKFYYSHETHWITDNRGSAIATAPGSPIACAPGSRIRTATASILSPPARSRPAPMRSKPRSTRPGTRTTAP